MLLDGARRKLPLPACCFYAALCRERFICIKIWRFSHTESVTQRYRCIATSVEGFVQQLASCYLRHGYWWYVTGVVPDWKDTSTVDEKLISKYGVAVSESTRARRKRLGRANMQYLRHSRFFMLLATKGTHEFFESEAGAIRDIRRVPLKYFGYSISFRPGGRTRSGSTDPKWHSHVQIERERYKEELAYFLELARKRTAEQIAWEFSQLPFEPYAPVRRQMLAILRATNKERKRLGKDVVPTGALRFRRRVVKPFQLPVSAMAESLQTLE